MAIWLWIIAAWAISLAFLKGKKIRMEHLIWMLLPVDMYGLTIAGITLKPYMIFCGFLLFRKLLIGEIELSVKSRWSVISGVIILLLIGVNAFNNQSIQSLISSAMLAVVWCCCMIYLSDCDNNSPEEISEVLVATGIGFGAVFVIGYLCWELNLNLPGILAETRGETGFIMAFHNMYDGELLNTVRLRGFTIDPNAIIGTFLFSLCISLFRIVTGKGGIREVLAVILSIWCAILSNSRMGLICSIVVGVCSIIVSYRWATARGKSRVKLVVLCFVVLLFISIVTGILPRIISSIIANFENRSGLNDEYGRFTIWKDAAEIWWKKSPFFGIGFGQMQYHTVMARACHNTWLEVLCANGLFLGGATIIHFVIVMLRGLCSGFRMPENTFTWAMVLGTMGIMISLIAVDNLMFSYLWFCTSVISVISDGCWRKK